MLIYSTGATSGSCWLLSKSMLNTIVRKRMPTRFQKRCPVFAWVALNQAILSAGAAAIVVALSYLLSEPAFGSIRFVSSVLAVLAFFSLPGINTLVVKDVNSIGRTGVIQAITTQLKWGLVASAVGVGIGLYYLSGNNDDLGLAFVIGGLLAPLANLYLMPGHLLAGVRKFRGKTLIDGTIIAVTFASAAAGAFFSGTISGTILAYFGSQAAITFFFLLYVVRSIPLHGTHSSADIGFGKQLTLFHVPFLLLPSIERVLVFFFLGPVALAVFVVATIPVEHTRNALRSMFQFYVLPYLTKAKGDTQILREWLRRAFFITSATAIAAAAAVQVLMPYLFAKYPEAYSLALIFLISLVPLPLYLLPLSWVSRKQTTPLKYSAISAVLINVLLFSILVPGNGMTGAIIAKIGSEFLIAGALLVFNRLNQNQLVATVDVHRS